MYELLQLLGRSSDKDKSGEEEPFTTQRLRAAVTPERVAAMRKTTVEEAAAHLKQLTMRMCMLLAGGPSKAHLFRDSIEAVVNEYGEYGLLLHVAVDWVALQIGGCAGVESERLRGHGAGRMRGGGRRGFMRGLVLEQQPNKRRQPDLQQIHVCWSQLDGLISSCA